MAAKTEVTAAEPRIVDDVSVQGGAVAGTVTAQVEEGAPAALWVPFLSPRWEQSDPPVIMLSPANAVAADTPAWTRPDVRDGQSGFWVEVPAVVVAGPAAWNYSVQPQG